MASHPSFHKCKPGAFFAPPTRFHAQTTQRPRRPYLTTHPPPCRMRNKSLSQCANLRGFPNVGKVEQHDPVGCTNERLRNLSSWCYYLCIHCDPPPFKASNQPHRGTSPNPTKAQPSSQGTLCSAQTSHSQQKLGYDKTWKGRMERTTSTQLTHTTRTTENRANDDRFPHLSRVLTVQSCLQHHRGNQYSEACEASQPPLSRMGTSASSDHHQKPPIH
ncbi:uncharacterized protein CLUP02_11979 [Colletotrichum lupini]|uniref:Uncharacterized protein n=1 Tax=Colletotrichum lupini TaxID=145971 RepID=A0A9Q8T089_9PEZI|nr:uncharacterized protein CLUP02_11979 [Colletotrichum lupini]UQC86478.1 hypothetical protein CLUP02_11979 [Colletotrichum lupini]